MWKSLKNFINETNFIKNRYNENIAILDPQEKGGTNRILVFKEIGPTYSDLSTVNPEVTKCPHHNDLVCHTPHTRRVSMN